MRARRPNPALARGEDTAVMHAMLARGRVLLLDAPWASTCVQTGVNTWAAEHFAAIWTAASFEQRKRGMTRHWPPWERIGRMRHMRRR